MKAVLLSIQPVWCSKIVLKEKTVEVRKTKPEGVKLNSSATSTARKNSRRWGGCESSPAEAGSGWMVRSLASSSATRFGSLHRYAAPRMMSKKWLAWTETALSAT